MSELKETLRFIEKIEGENHNKSTYEIANKLRGYTKPEYTTSFWRIATGYDQKYIDGESKGKLNKEKMVLSGEVTDFGHLIASLSDQINQPGVNWSDLTGFTADHTSWAGDIGSAIIVYRSQYRKVEAKTLAEALDKLASDSDYTADIAAYAVGTTINSSSEASIAKAIYQYDATSYTAHVRTFIEKRLGGIIEGDMLKNPADVDAEIRKPVATFISLSPAADLLKSVKDLLRLPPKAGLESTLLPHGADILQGSLHFLTHLVKEGSLESLKFKPYQMPGVPWLGTVNYEVSVPNLRSQTAYTTA